jgi:lipopolysaccharide export LptBFGC system permease protein LptF
MDRNTILWALVVFFGATVAFQGVQRATDDESVALTIGLEVVVLALIVGGILLYIRRRG